MLGKLRRMSQDSRRPMDRVSRIRGIASPPPTGTNSPLPVKLMAPRQSDGTTIDLDYPRERHSSESRAPMAMGKSKFMIPSHCWLVQQEHLAPVLFLTMPVRMIRLARL